MTLSPRASGKCQIFFRNLDWKTFLGNWKFQCPEHRLRHQPAVFHARPVAVKMAAAKPKGASAIGALPRPSDGFVVAVNGWVR